MNLDLPIANTAPRTSIEASENPAPISAQEKVAKTGFDTPATNISKTG